MKRSAFVAVTLCLLVGACSGKPEDPRAQKGLPETAMMVGSKQFTVEVAATYQRREIGMMFRRDVPGDRGMLFVMPTEEVQTFWMKDCPSALDIVYADGAGRVVAVKKMNAFDLSPVSSDKPAKYAVELGPGVAATTGIKVGDTVSIPAGFPPE